MSVSHNINNYPDVAAVLRAAYDRKGGTYELETPGFAIHWRLRANMYKKLLQALHIQECQEREEVPPPLWIDHLVFSTEANKVHIKLNRPRGTLYDPHGAVIEIQSEPLPTTGPSVLDEDEINRLLADAENLFEDQALFNPVTGEGVGASTDNEQDLLARRIQRAKEAANQTMESKE